MTAFTHHSHVGGEGHAFVGFILGAAAAAASEGVSPNDTWGNNRIKTKHFDRRGRHIRGGKCETHSLALEWQHVQALQAVPAGRRVASLLGQAALAAGEHGGGRHDARRGNLPHLLVQLLDLSLLGGLQGLHLRQMSDEGQGGGHHELVIQCCGFYSLLCFLSHSSRLCECPLYYLYRRTTSAKRDFQRTHGTFTVVWMLNNVHDTVSNM